MLFKETTKWTHVLTRVISPRQIKNTRIVFLPMCYYENNLHANQYTQQSDQRNAENNSKSAPTLSSGNQWLNRFNRKPKPLLTAFDSAKVKQMV